MRALRLLLVLFVAALTLSAAGAAPPQKLEAMPSAVPGNDPRHPIFLEASRVIDENGRIRRDAPLTAMAARYVTILLERPRTGGCINLEEAYLDYVNAPVRMGLAGAIGTSDFVIETRVEGQSFGFMEGIPGQLLRLSDVKLLNGAPSDIRRNYYIFVPVAEFTVGGLHVCKTDRRYGAAPRLGDTVFVFVDKRFVSDDFINVVDSTGYARALPDGRVLLPKSLRGNDETPVSSEDIRQMARERGRRLEER